MSDAMALDTYNEKRHFKKTPEPKGVVKHAAGHSYVIQKHAASHLHYDFRLELDGVLLSWAVPKGPSLDPSIKRLAMQVEDHPVEYGGFEGTIPKGEYGGGTVMVWDRGTWEPEGDARKDYARGRLTFTLHGEKLKGTWHLVRTAGDASERKRWLLFKGADAEAKRKGPGVVEEMPASALTGRSLDDIAAEGDRTWHSNRAQIGARRRDARSEIAQNFRPPELATLVKEAPAGDRWLHEVKLDGYRIVAHVNRGKVTLFSRNGKDWTDRMPSITRALAHVDAKNAVLDGEVVVLREDGVSDFQRLQNALGAGDDDLTYFVFDLLELDGRDLRSEPLEARKAALAPILPKNGASRTVRSSDHVVGNGARFFENACKLGLEGIVSKRRDAPYTEGRGRDWLKVKCVGRQEFVIVGFTDAKSSRAQFGALLLAVRKGRTLTYVGKVGTGFSAASLESIGPKLRALSVSESPLASPPRERGVHWVTPKLVCEVDFASITNDGMLRHASFRGLRQDKSADEVVLEAPAPKPKKSKTTTPTNATNALAAKDVRARITHADKVLYPESGVTKGDVAVYLERASAFMLPHVAGRPLMLMRCPSGIGKCFIQKHATKTMPAGARAIDVGDDEKHMTVDDVSGLVGLAQAGVLEIHTWGSHADDVEHPDLLVFDLDPDPAVAWPEVISAAQLVRARLESLGLEAFVKTTGGKGLHVVCAIAPTMTWDAAKDFSREVSEAVVREQPMRFVATMSKAKRKGKIFIDHFRNGRGATFVAPYSPRARPGAPVAMPLAWEELSEKIKPDHFTVKNAIARLDALERDPWEKLAPRLTKARRSAPSPATKPRR